MLIPTTRPTSRVHNAITGNPRRRPPMAQSRDKCNRPNAPQNEHIPTEITQQEPKTALQHKMQQTSKPILSVSALHPKPTPHTKGRGLDHRHQQPSPLEGFDRLTPKPTRRLQKPLPIPKANSTASDAAAAVNTQTPHAHEAYRNCRPPKSTQMRRTDLATLKPTDIPKRHCPPGNHRETPSIKVRTIECVRPVLL